MKNNRTSRIRRSPLTGCTDTFDHRRDVRVHFGEVGPDLGELLADLAQSVVYSGEAGGHTIAAAQLRRIPDVGWSAPVHDSRQVLRMPAKRHGQCLECACAAPSLHRVAL